MINTKTQNDVLYKSCVQSQEFPVEDLPNHSSSEIGHVFLKIENDWFLHTQLLPTLIDSSGEMGGSPAHLCKCDWPVFGDVLGILACEHAAVTSIHLVRNLLRITNKDVDGAFCLI